RELALVHRNADQRRERWIGGFYEQPNLVACRQMLGGEDGRADFGDDGPFEPGLLDPGGSGPDEDATERCGECEPAECAAGPALRERKSGKRSCGGKAEERLPFRI